MLTLNRSRRIIKCVVIGVLFTCVLLGLSSAPIFAASEEVDFPSSSEVSPFDLVVPEEFLDPVYEKLAAGDVRATYTVSDVYVLLSSALVGESNSSTYSLPRIAYYTWQTWSRLNTTNNYLSNILSGLVDGNSSSIPVGPGIRQTLFGIDGQGNWETVFDTSQDTRDLAQLIYASTQQIHGDGQNNSYYLSQLVSNSSSFKWVNSPVVWAGTSTDWNTTYIPSSPGYSTGNRFIANFTFNDNLISGNPGVLRLFLPFYSLSTINFDQDFYKLSGVRVGPSYWISSIPDYFIEPVNNGIYLYIFDYRPISGYQYHFEITSSVAMVGLAGSASASYLPFDSYEYHLIYNTFYEHQSIKSNSAYDQAQQASQPVIDDTLSGFTGNGSAAAKTSDTGSMKNMSGSIQSGLDSGASASNAASVFSNQTFWSWFTQATSNGINNPYPAPVVQNVRGSGDEVPDFLSGNQSELNDLLNQRNSW